MTHHEHSPECKCCCCQHQCQQHHHTHEHHEGHFSDELLALADEAWMEVVKEKIKKQIEETTGAHLDKLAQLVSTANHQKWNSKLALMKAKEEYEAKLSDYFS